MLVAAFQVHIRRPGQLRPHRKHCLVRRAGVEPDVEDVHFFLEVAVAALRTGHSCRQEFLNRPLVPRVGPVRLKHAGRLFHERDGRDRLSAAFAVHGRYRHAPYTLARNAPVGPARYHVVDAVMAPRRNPFHVVIDGGLGGFAQRAALAVALDRRSAVHPDEPLRGGEKNDGIVAAPAVWILVREI